MLLYDYLFENGKKILVFSRDLSQGSRQNRRHFVLSVSFLSFFFKFQNVLILLAWTSVVDPVQYKKAMMRCDMSYFCILAWLPSQTNNTLLLAKITNEHCFKPFNWETAYCKPNLVAVVIQTKDILHRNKQHD